MAENPGFNKLFEPGKIGSVKIKNRIFKTGAGSTLGDGSGRVHQRHKAFYGALAKGGLGLIVVEGPSFYHVPGSKEPPASPFLRLDDDTFIPSLKELTDLIHKYNCQTFLQTMVGGATESTPGTQPLSSSYITPDELKVRQPYHKGYLLREPKSPRPYTIEELENLKAKWVEVAERAARAGFDGLELNAGNGHLLNAFHSRVWNRRDDKYGCQNLENRTRLTVEILQAIKKKMGQDFPITVGLTVAEYGIEDATTLEEGVGMARIIAQGGADAIWARVHGYQNVSMDIIWPERVFIPEPPNPLPKDMDWSHFGAGSHAPLASAVKKAVSVPILVAGRIYPELAEKILEGGKADFIGMTRRLQADPELPNKVAERRLDDIAPCTACSHCLESNSNRVPIVCRINAALGHEAEYTILPAKNRKKVVVVGGGPAGMEAARVAATRGEEVWLFEKNSKLGGMMPMAALVKGTEIEDIPAMMHYLEYQIRKLGVKIHTGKEFIPSMAEDIKPDVVILATGGIAVLPDIPGINRRNVVSSGNLHHQLKLLLKFFGPNTLRTLTKYWMPIGKRVIIIGGAIQGLELAEFLVKRGRKVTVVDTAQEFGALMPVRNRIKLMKWLPEKGATLISVSRYGEVTDKGLSILTRDGKWQILEADTITTALPLKTNTGLKKDLEGKVPELYAIGDCNDPRLILHAVSDGYRVASNI